MHFPVALHAAQPTVSMAVAPLPIDLHAIGESVDKPVTLEVLPPPGPDGTIVGRDGRKHRVPDVSALSGALNAQAVQPRVDFDHASEPSSATFNGSTGAEGWLENFRINARGGIAADARMGDDAHAALRRRRYRYLSPAVLVNARNEVVGLSSAALVNNPNFDLKPPATHNQGAGDLEEREAKLKRDQEDLKRDQAAQAQAALHAATATVEAAIVAGQIPAPQKDYHVAAIQGHAEGVWAGITAFNEAFGTDAGGGGAAATNDLTRRVAPRGAPPAQHGRHERLAFRTAPGAAPPGEDQLELHRNVAEYAAKRGISFRQAVSEYGPLFGV